MKKKFDPYTFLWHAELHCQFGSETVDREPDAGDIAAVKLLHRLKGDAAVEKWEERSKK